MLRARPRGKARKYPHKLTKFERRFCNEYLIDLNGANACRRAGYSDKGKNAADMAYKMLHKEHILSYIATLMNERMRRLEIKGDDVLRKLVAIGFADIGQFCDWTKDTVSLIPREDLPPDIRGAIAEISQTKRKDGTTLKVKLHNGPHSLELIGRHLGMFNDKLSVLLRRDDVEDYTTDELVEIIANDPEVAKLLARRRGEVGTRTAPRGEEEPTTVH